MIGQYTLMMLCEKYGINSDKLVNKNNNILTYGEYQDIDSTLNYLVNTLKISSNNIEKCPSILYKSVNNIKENVDFIKNCNIHFSNIESCLHVLNSEPLELQATYEYVKENYGLDIINKLTSILSVPKKSIIPWPANKPWPMPWTWAIRATSCASSTSTTTAGSASKPRSAAPPTPTT